VPASRLALSAAAVLLISACSSGGGTASPGASAGVPAPGAASAAASSAASNDASAPAAATRIEVALTDALKVELASSSVPLGIPVTFVIKNTGTGEHEFYLGDEAAQAAHEQDMVDSGMAHGETDGVSVPPGETKEFTYTFTKAGETLTGCHVAGHYAAGMKAAITVVS